MPFKQPESPGGRDDTDGTYQQLSLFPSEADQIAAIDHLEPAESMKPSAFFVSGTEPAQMSGELPEESLEGSAVPPLSENEISLARAAEISPQNYRITDDHLGEGGPKAKYERNVEAIRTLFALEQENRNATPEEQSVLAQYVGWGGLPDAFDPEKAGWAREYQELKGLLPEQEYEMARASTLNAHYTSPTVIKAIYEAVGGMGFTSGNILEPSMGVGNFFGLLPDEMSGSRLYGVELDSISGRIAQKLYPNAEITVAGFETTDRRDFYDLAVGNVPFGNYRVSDKPYDKLGFSIHNYFFAKALDQVRPGGIVAFVTSRYTMDSKNSDARRYLAQRAELLAPWIPKIRTQGVIWHSGRNCWERSDFPIMPLKPTQGQR